MGWLNETSSQYGIKAMPYELSGQSPLEQQGQAGKTTV